MRKSFVFLICAILFTSTAFAQTNKAFKKGYRGSVEVGTGVAGGTMQKGFLTIGKEANAEDQWKPAEFMNISTVHGYQLGNGVFLGIGLGWSFEMLDGMQYGSAFADIKYNIVDASASPFVEGRTGYRINSNLGGRGTEGLFISAAGGVDFGPFSASLGFDYCPYLQTGKSSTGSIYRYCYTMNQFFFSLAFNF